MSDFTLVGDERHGLITLIPNTALAEDWLEFQLPADAGRLGKGVVIEHRYVADVLDGIEIARLTIMEP